MEEMMIAATAFTGHRPERLPEEGTQRYALLVQLLRDEIRKRIDRGCRVFYCGMAMGTDILCGEIVLEEKRQGRKVELVCAVPFEGQADRWGSRWKLRHQALIEGADRVEVLCPGYRRDCFHIRNRYMVDHADAVIAVFGGGSGGTSYTVAYARKKHRELLIVNPDNLETTLYASLL